MNKEIITVPKEVNETPNGETAKLLYLALRKKNKEKTPTALKPLSQLKIMRAENLLSDKKLN